MKALIRKLAWWRRRRDLETDLLEELAFHLSEEADERHADGASEADAVWAARRDLGNLARLHEETRVLWTWTVFEQFVQDLRFAARTMRRNRVFTALAALSLALGIGANTAIYSFMEAILLRRLPVAQAEALAVVKWHSRPFAFGRELGTRPSEFVVHSVDGQIYDDAGGSTSRIFPLPAFERLREVSGPVMSTFFAYHPGGRLNVIANGEADVAQGEYVSGEYFGGLGVVPTAGRPILPSDDRTGADPVAMLSFGYARRHFAQAASAVGHAIRINNESYAVVGITPAEFFGVDPAAAPDVYLPLHAGPISPDPNTYWLEMMGRMRPGVGLAHAQAAFDTAFQSWVATTAANDAERGNLPHVRVEAGGGGLDTLRRKYSKPLYVLMSMVGLILIIACANTANLLLARASARKREIAVRLGVGSGRGRIVRQLLTESVCLGCLSGAIGIPVAFASMRVLTLLLANGQTSLTLHAALNWQMLVVTLLLSVTCGILFGLAPALQSTNLSLVPALKGGRGPDAGATGRSVVGVTLSQALVVAQIAMSLVLLVGAGLFVRTLSNLESVPLGFNPDRLLLLDVNAPQAGYAAGRVTTFYADLQRRLAGIAGVSDVSLSHASLIRAGRTLPVTVNGTPTIGPRILSVGSAFFTTVGIQLREGRDIDEHDQQTGRPVAVVSELFARTYFGNENPIGQSIGIGGRGNAPRDSKSLAWRPQRFTEPCVMTGRQSSTCPMDKCCPSAR